MVWSTRTIVALCAFFPTIRAYIPATPTNETSSLDSLSGYGTFKITWAQEGSYVDELTIRWLSEGSRGSHQGPLVRFSEVGPPDNATNSTLAPWIAFVSCDRNSTESSEQFDIFTLARNRGAVAAVLYSTFSQACVLNDQYKSNDELKKELDIFAPNRLNTARLIDSQFRNIDASNFGSYNPGLLNESATVINSSIETGINTSGYLLAEIKVRDTDDLPINDNSSTETTSTLSVSGSAQTPPNPSASSSANGSVRVGSHPASLVTTICVILTYILAPI